jgi:glucose-6-phosphate isomerase
MTGLPLNQTGVFSDLTQLAASPFNLRSSLTADRIHGYRANHGPLDYWFGTALVTDPILDLLQQLADSQNVVSRFGALFSENRLNPTENRGVTHIQRRSPDHREWLGPVAAFAAGVHSGDIRSWNGQTFTDVIQIGIGGSELGPRAAYHALVRWTDAHGLSRLTAKFIANLDSDDGLYTASKVDLNRTLVIVVSKSGGTLETQANAALIEQLAVDQGIPIDQFRSHMIVVTTQGSRLDNGSFGHSFYLDEGVGGRFSVTSAAGMVLLALCFDPTVTTQFLDGACALDAIAMRPSIRENIPLLSALIGIWDRSFLKLPGRAVIPYSEGLRFLPAHLQQLECESCGKSVNLDGLPVEYPTSPLVFGHTGTQAQHSFFQNLHQGTDIIPVEFVAVRRGQLGNGDIQTSFIASVVGQMSGLALGRHHQDPRKNCPGNRPSTLVIVDELTPYTLGALLAYYENRTVFQGFLWHINPFDQEGVELGKLLCQQVLDGFGGVPTELFSEIMGGAEA